MGLHCGLHMPPYLIPDAVYYYLGAAIRDAAISFMPSNTMKLSCKISRQKVTISRQKVMPSYDASGWL